MTEPQKLSLTVRIFIGMIAGAAAGLLLNAVFGESGDLVIAGVSLNDNLVDGLFGALGQIFIASLKMLVVPLVFISLVCGTSSLSEPSKLGSLGGKSIGLYITTTAIAISTAIIAALIIAPGEGLNLTTEATYSAKEAPALSQVFVNMFPSNPIASMAQGNMLQIIVFAVFFGVALTLAGDSGERIKAAFNDLNNVMMKIVSMVMAIAPYGVFVLMAKLFASIGFDTILGLAKYFFLVFPNGFGHIALHFLVVGTQDLLVHFHTLQLMRQQLGNTLHYVIYLLLNHENDRVAAQVSVRTIQHKEVRKFRGTHAAIRLCTFGPRVF